MLVLLEFRLAQPTNCWGLTASKSSGISLEETEVPTPGCRIRKVTVGCFRLLEVKTWVELNDFYGKQLNFL